MDTRLVHKDLLTFVFFRDGFFLLLCVGGYEICLYTFALYTRRAGAPYGARLLSRCSLGRGSSACGRPWWPSAAQVGLILALARQSLGGLQFSSVWPVSGLVGRGRNFPTCGRLLRPGAGSR